MDHDTEPDQLYVRGWPYVRNWARARVAATEANTSLREMGLPVRALPGTDATGHPQVRLAGAPAAVLCAVRLIRRGAGVTSACEKAACPVFSEIGFDGAESGVDVVAMAYTNQVERLGNFVTENVNWRGENEIPAPPASRYANDN